MSIDGVNELLNVCESRCTEGLPIDGYEVNWTSVRLGNGEVQLLT